MFLSIGLVLAAAGVSLAPIIVRSTDLEIFKNPNGGGAGSDSYRLRFYGEVSGSTNRTWNLQNVANATGDEYRLAFTNDLSTEVVTFEDDGSVGIGTTSPSDRLHVAQQANESLTGLLELTASSDGDAVVINEGIFVGFQIPLNSTAGSASDGAGIAVARANATNNDASSYMAIYTNGSGSINERVRITSLGAVGIGITSPGEASIAVYALNSQDSDLGIQSLIAASDGDAVARDEGPAITFAVPLSSTSGSYREGGALGVFRENATDGNSDSYFAYSSVNSVGVATERFRATSAGRLGIGTTGPTTTLDVSGNVRISGTNSTELQSSTSSTAANSYAISGTNSGTGSGLKYGVYGESTGGGTGTNIGVAGISRSTAGFQAGGYFESADSSGVGELSAILLNRSTSGTAAAGFGVSIFFQLEDAAGDTESAARITPEWANATSGSESSQIGFYTRMNGGNVTEQMILSAEGHLGIGVGITSPTTRLQVRMTTTNSNVDLLRVVSNVGGDNNVKFRVDSDGDVFSDGGTSMSTPADIAEKYPTDDPSLEPGDVVVLTDEVARMEFLDHDSGRVEPRGGGAGRSAKIARAGRPADPRLFGVISTDPGVLLAAGLVDSAAVALTGRVPVKVTLEGGPIRPGDPLTSSSTPGHAMRMTASGPTLGIALESFDGPPGSSGKIHCFVQLRESQGGWEAGSVSVREALSEMNESIESLESRLTRVEARLDAQE